MNTSYGVAKGTKFSIDDPKRAELEAQAVYLSPASFATSSNPNPIIYLTSTDLDTLIFRSSDAPQAPPRPLLDPAKTVGSSACQR